MKDPLLRAFSKSLFLVSSLNSFVNTSKHNYAIFKDVLAKIK